MAVARQRQRAEGQTRHRDHRHLVDPLLKSFINAHNLDEKVLIWQTVIHMTFVLSAISIAYIDKLMPQKAH
jgi:Predicted membrane protein